MIVGPISMLGDSIPVAAGIGMGARMRGKTLVSMAWIGDGATSTGAFHEGLNFAAVQKAPLVVVAEDNKFAYSTPIAKQMRSSGSTSGRQLTGSRTRWWTATTSSRSTTWRSGWWIAPAPAKVRH